VFNEIINFEDSALQTIPAKNLEPYNTYIFKVIAKNQFGKEGFA
jgi:hypothetical protein